MKQITMRAKETGPEPWRPPKAYYWNKFHYSYRVYLDFKARGLDCFGENGTYDGFDGSETIKKIMEIFEDAEMCRDCIFLRSLLTAYTGKYKSPVDACGVK